MYMEKETFIGMKEDLQDLERSKSKRQKVLMERTYSCPMSPRGWKAKGGGCTWVATSKIKYKQRDKARKLTYTIVQLSCVYIFITSINIYIFFSKNITPPPLKNRAIILDRTTCITTAGQNRSLVTSHCTPTYIVMTSKPYKLIVKFPATVSSKIH